VNFKDATVKGITAILAKEEGGPGTPEKGSGECGWQASGTAWGR